MVIIFTPFLDALACLLIATSNDTVTRGFKQIVDGVAVLLSSNTCKKYIKKRELIYRFFLD